MNKKKSFKRFLKKASERLRPASKLESFIGSQRDIFFERKRLLQETFLSPLRELLNAYDLQYVCELKPVQPRIKEHKIMRFSSIKLSRDLSRTEVKAIIEKLKELREELRVRGKLFDQIISRVRERMLKEKNPENKRLLKKFLVELEVNKPDFSSTIYDVIRGFRIALNEKGIKPD
jgi:hypothetical protein